MNSAAISVLTEAGIQGVEAEIALRRIQSQLVAPPAEAREKLEELGFVLSELDPNLHRLVEIVRRLARAELGEDDARAIFGGDGAPAMMALIRGVERFEELQKPV